MSTPTNTAPEVKPAIDSTRLASLLTGPLGVHDYDMGPMHIEQEGDKPAYTFQNFNFSLGGLLAGHVRGANREKPAGYPEPTIAEGEAIRAEIIRRWNCHAELVKIIERALAHVSQRPADAWFDPFIRMAMEDALVAAKATTKETAAHV